ncbi:MAG: GMC family oxidoreductase N-terminal domain-containing protein, partial [Actinomycetota bacterium]
PRDAEAALQRLLSSRLAARRRLAQGLVALSVSSLYGYPGSEWERIGYPGPLGDPPAEPRRLEPLRITADEVMNCDVVVVGSGAGGGCVAAGLAGAGLDVIVVEKGSYNSEADFTHLEPASTQSMYLYGQTLATVDLSCQILAGSTLGGGTVVNYATSFRTPEHVLREWAESSGIDAFASGEFEESLDEVSERLGVNTNSSAAGRRDALLEDGLKKLGWHVDMMPRAVRGCTQDEQCGYCGFGCRVGAKQSSMRTYLEDAAAHGARLVVDAEVRRVSVVEGRATGIEAVSDGHSLVINASGVVAAAGAIETPALLLRSGLRGEVGRGLHLHPGTGALALFDDEVRMWEGTTQARYSNEFRHWDGGYGPILETVPIHPGAGSTALPWISSSSHRDLMGRFSNVGFCAVLPRDKGSGRVRVARDGTPRVHYTMSAEDERRVAEGVVAAARVMEAAGAREVFAPHSDFISYVPGTPGAHQHWAEETRRIGYRSGRVTTFSFHQMGSCRMGSDPARSAVDPDNETHEVRGLYVTDASCFPTASGVNPMLTVYAIANRAAKRITARLA